VFISGAQQGSAVALAVLCLHCLYQTALRTHDWYAGPISNRFKSCLCQFFNIFPQRFSPIHVYVLDLKYEPICAIGVLHNHYCSRPRA